MRVPKGLSEKNNITNFCRTINDPFQIFRGQIWTFCEIQWHCEWYSRHLNK